MKCKTCLLFASAFLGAIMMYCLHVAASFRTNPNQFRCPCLGSVVAQVTISFVVVALTFISLYRDVVAEKPREAWHAYMKAFTQAGVLELVIDAIQSH